MIKRLAATALIALAPITAAHAQTVEQCLKDTFAVAQAVQSKRPSEAQIKTMEEALMKIEKLCDEKKFDDAAKAREDLKGMISRM